MGKFRRFKDRSWRSIRDNPTAGDEQQAVERFNLTEVVKRSQNRALGSLRFGPQDLERSQHPMGIHVRQRFVEE